MTLTQAAVNSDDYIRHGGVQAARDAQRVASGTDDRFSHNRHWLSTVIASLEADPTHRRIRATVAAPDLVHGGHIL